MKVKSTLSVMTLGLAVLTGCESLDKSVVAGAGGAAANAGRGDRRAAIAAGATGAAVATAAMTNDSRSELATSKPTASAQRSTRGGQQTSTASAPVSKPKDTVAEPHEKAVNIAEIADDKEFFDALKKLGKTEDEVILKRGMKMKDEKLFAEFFSLYSNQVVEVVSHISFDDNEFFAVLKKIGKTKDEKILKRGARMKDDKLRLAFIGLYPDQVDDVVWWSFVDSHKVTDPGLAEVLIDKMKNVGVTNSDRFFYLAKLLDSKARAKHLARAKENREKATKDGVIMMEKFYIGMPVIDYVMIALEDKQEWTKWREDQAYCGWLKNRVDEETDISGKDWKTAWKVNDLSFDTKSRYKYFKVKGTVDGLFEFVKKYLDKSAQRKDITINGNWWQFTDEEHELKVGMNDENGILNIYGI